MIGEFCYEYWSDVLEMLDESMEEIRNSIEELEDGDLDSGFVHAEYCADSLEELKKAILRLEDHLADVLGEKFY